MSLKKLQGLFRVRVEAQDAQSAIRLFGERLVSIHDYWLVALGDSYVAGEGALPMQRELANASSSSFSPRPLWLSGAGDIAQHREKAAIEI